MSTAADLIDEFAREVVAQNPFHANFMKSSIGAMSEDRKDKLYQYMVYCQSRGLDMSELVDAYNTITIDTQMEQIYFRKNGRYRWSRFSEVASNVYFDSAYMRKYMYGLALTSFLWPNHAAIHDFFIRTFPVGIGGSYLEVGPGHGYYFMEAARIGGFSRLLGVDISASSISMTRDIVGHFGIDRSREIDLVEADFLSFDPGEQRFSCIVMGEVLEHVEEPAVFLQRLARMADSRTHIYVTTCVNAPAVDHIFLFRDPAEIEEMALQQGLEIADRFYAPYGDLTVEESIARALPVNVAYVLRKP